MKKLKIMLLSLALFAVVGGALAFKARFNTQYCTAPLPGSGTCGDTGVFCPNLTTSTEDGAGQQPFVCTTTPQVGCTDGHNNQIRCVASTQLIKD